MNVQAQSDLRWGAMTRFVKMSLLMFIMVGRLQRTLAQGDLVLVFNEALSDSTSYALFSSAAGVSYSTGTTFCNSTFSSATPDENNLTAVGTVARVSSDEEAAFLVTQLNNHDATSPNTFWMGLFDPKDQAGQNPLRFQYVDGFIDKSFFASFGVYPWQQGQPNNFNDSVVVGGVLNDGENCVSFIRNDTEFGGVNVWSDFNCNFKNSLLCRIEFTKVVDDPGQAANSADGKINPIAGAAIIGLAVFIFQIAFVLIIRERRQTFRRLTQGAIRVDQGLAKARTPRGPSPSQIAHANGVSLSIVNPAPQNVIRNPGESKLRNLILSPPEQRPSGQYISMATEAYGGNGISIAIPPIGEGDKESRRLPRYHVPSF